MLRRCFYTKHFSDHFIETIQSDRRSRESAIITGTKVLHCKRFLTAVFIGNKILKRFCILYQGKYVWRVGAKRRGWVIRVYSQTVISLSSDVLMEWCIFNDNIASTSSFRKVLMCSYYFLSEYCFSESSALVFNMRANNSFLPWW